jgi:hypothetical protein
MTEILLDSHDNPGVDGDEVVEDDIFVSVNNSVICSSFFATIPMSVRPSKELSLANCAKGSPPLESFAVSAWTSEFSITL